MQIIKFSAGLMIGAAAGFIAGNVFMMIIVPAILREGVNHDYE